ncbi:hypothetical protein Cantr_01806 [Candida viswanathii]|uniref:Trans-sulfuration enzyme n=1 Tax=Candida viswanathii TaxID=5486 RepID=A0A367YLW4_9ASCO|nr:hypothetical protein Cantr_01806 [Candida viswanathii]
MTRFATDSIHGGDHLKRVNDVITPIHITTTYSYAANPDDLQTGQLTDPNTMIYLRANHPNAAQVEAIVEKITGYPAVVYNSGLGAFNGLITHVNPRAIAFGQIYHGVQGIADIWTRNFGLKQIGLDDDYAELQEGDLVHLETPVNPYGTNLDILKYAEKAHSRGALLSVDATFAPPPLQDPFAFGADIVLHSATKFFGGHSDLLAGILLVKSQDVKNKLLVDRLVLGTNIGNLESALLVRSLRTFELRVARQSSSAEFIVKYIAAHKDKFPDLETIYHGSLQADAFIKKQMPLSQSPVFAIELVSPDKAKRLPSRLKIFHHATSLGGAESLIEWRAMSDDHISKKLLRVSIGLEDPRDLLADFVQALGGDEELVAEVEKLEL